MKCIFVGDLEDEKTLVLERSNIALIRLALDF